MSSQNAHAARVQNGLVLQVIVIPYCNDDDTAITEYCNSIGLAGTWLDTSYLGARRGNYAGIGFTYDEALDAFIPPKPYESWVLNEDTFSWEAPIPYPAEGDWSWDEQAGVWVEVEDEAG
jgi:hypothetical protein